MEGDAQAIIKTIAYISTIVFFLLASGMVYLIYIYAKRQKQYHNKVQNLRKKNEAELLRATLTIQENERERIGANLHDDIGPLLSSFKMYFKNELKNKKGADRAEIQDILTALDDNIEQVRDFSRDLVPNVLHQFGFKSAIEELKRRFEKNNDISINMNLPDALRLNIQYSLSLYRIVQESINNAIRHGNASVIEISIIAVNEQYEVTISDNGSGFNQELKQIGLGLRNIEARCKSMDSRLRIMSKEGKGTTIKITGLNYSHND